MFDWFLSHYPTLEDRSLPAEWARGIAIIYGPALLLLLGIAVGNEFLSGHGNGKSEAAIVHVSQNFGPQARRAEANNWRASAVSEIPLPGS